MPDYTLFIKVGDGVNSFYECEMKDGWGRKIFMEGETILKDKKEFLGWVEKNLPTLFIDGLDKSKIDIDKVVEEMKKNGLMVISAVCIFSDFIFRFWAFFVK